MAENMGNLRRTNYCGLLSSKDVGKKVVITGWVQ